MNAVMKLPHDAAELTEEQRPRETPNGRRPIADFTIAGPFPPAAD